MMAKVPAKLKGKPRSKKGAAKPISASPYQPWEEPRGRPATYRPEFAARACEMAKLGATDFDIAEELGVKTSTIWRWRSMHEEFSSALNEGKNAFDDRIERSLAMKAAGYSFHTEKTYCFEGNITRADVVEHVPPDVGAITLWLCNRRPKEWRQKQEVQLDGSTAFIELLKMMSEQNAHS